MDSDGVRLTAKVRAVAQLGFLVATGQHANSSVLDEVHLASNCALTDDEVRGLEHFESKLCQHGSYKIGIGVGKEGHVGHEAAAVKADDFLDKEEKKGRRNDFMRVSRHVPFVCVCEFTTSFSGSLSSPRMFSSSNIFPWKRCS